MESKHIPTRDEIINAIKKKKQAKGRQPGIKIDLNKKYDKPKPREFESNHGVKKSSEIS